MGEVFDAFQSEKFLKRYIPVSKNQLVKSIGEIKIKTPLVLKIISKDALHKTEINGQPYGKGTLVDLLGGSGGGGLDTSTGGGG
ncbi:TPA: hypothetical protein EYQ19_02490, partial [Candidatus Pacearchaeota archaeon]|nr:hypothetical protein [Candidatus Pacearchaeota archaeon]